MSQPSPNIYDWIDALEPPDTLDFAESKTDAGFLAIGGVSRVLSSFMDDNDISGILDRLAAADPGPAHQADIATLRRLFLAQ